MMVTVVLAVTVVQLEMLGFGAAALVQFVMVEMYQVVLAMGGTVAFVTCATNPCLLLRAEVALGVQS